MGPFCWSVGAFAAPPRVILSPSTFRALIAPVEAPVDPAPAPIVTRRDLSLTDADPDEVAIAARWTVQVAAPADVRWVVAGPEVRVEAVTLGGAPATVSTTSEGTVLSAHLTRDTTLTLRGTGPRAAPFALLPAAAGAVDHPAGVAVDGALPLGPRRSIGAPARMSLVPPPGRPDRNLLIGETALGVAVGDAEIHVRGVVRFLVSGRPVDAVSFAVEGAGPDLEVAGPQVAAWRREGDRVLVDLRAPERSLVVLEVSWSTPTPAGEASTLPVPRVAPLGVFKSTAALQLGRDAEIDVIPELRGWAVAAPSALPEWGRGLAPGTPAGAFTGRGDPATMTVLRFTPAPGPPTIIDVASFSGLVSPEGRWLLRATYAVRNDRAAVLRVRPPPGLAPIGAKVSGETVAVAREGEAWLVPLEKSVETVNGLLAFPVEVLFVGALPEWAPRAGTPVALPSVDAEVAVARLALALPRSWVARVSAGEGDVVEQFTAGETITYGYAVGDARAAEAEVVFQQAVDAWKDNRFGETEASLDRLVQMGAKSEGIDQLRSNLAVVDGEATGLVERRVLEQARARGLDDELAQQQELERAEEAYAAGEYDEAEQAYQRALDLGGELAKLRNIEDVAQQAVNEVVEKKLSVTRDVKQQKQSQAVSNAGPSPTPAASPKPIVDSANEDTVEDDADEGFVGGAANFNTYIEPEPRPQVTASGLGVVLPAAGDTVRYQSLLLPPGTTWEVSIRAKPQYRVPRRTP